MKAGVALNPHTKVDVLSDVIEDLDLVLIMSVKSRFWRTKVHSECCQKSSSGKRTY